MKIAELFWLAVLAMFYIVFSTAVYLCLDQIVSLVLKNLFDSSIYSSSFSILLGPALALSLSGFLTLSVLFVLRIDFDNFLSLLILHAVAWVSVLLPISFTVAQGVPVIVFLSLLGVIAVAVPLLTILQAKRRKRLTNLHLTLLLTTALVCITSLLWNPIVYSSALDSVDDFAARKIITQRLFEENQNLKVGLQVLGSRVMGMQLSTMEYALAQGYHHRFNADTPFDYVSPDVILEFKDGVTKKIDISNPN